MSGEDEIAAKIAGILKAALPAPTSTAGSPTAVNQQITLGTNTVQIAGDLCIISPGPQHISPAQAYELHQLINQAVGLEARSGADRKKLYAKWYSAIKKKFHTPSYKFIPADQADAALAWMRQHVARLLGLTPFQIYYSQINCQK